MKQHTDYTIDGHTIRIAVGDRFTSRDYHYSANLEVTHIYDKSIEYRNLDTGVQWTIPTWQAHNRIHRGIDYYLGTAWERQPMKQ
jgi:hypothetical protein